MSVPQGGKVSEGRRVGDESEKCTDHGPQTTRPHGTRYPEVVLIPQQ